MSVTVLPRHRCDLPDPRGYARGVRVECDECRQEWKLAGIFTLGWVFVPPFE